jgi:hypothetical protein
MTQVPIYHASIQPEWIDYNGHLRDAHYTLVASYAADALMDYLGLDAEYRQRTRCTLRIHVGCQFTCSRFAETAALIEMMLLHVHLADTPKNAPFPAATLSKLQDLKASAQAHQRFRPKSRQIDLQRR